MKRSIFKTTAALAVVSFVVMTSAISARCTDGVSYTSEELDENLEELNRDMAVQGTTIDKSTLAGSYEDPKIAHQRKGRQHLASLLLPELLRKKNHQAKPLRTKLLRAKLPQKSVTTSMKLLLQKSLLVLKKA